MKRTNFDLIVIGSGSGGNVAAHYAAKIGKRVAIIEADKIGGECPNVGCVPTKSLLHAAEIFNAAKDSRRFGIRAGGLDFNYPAIKAWKDSVVKQTGTEEGIDFFEAEGIKVIRGHAQFLNKWTVSVGHNHYTARKFIIATGTRPVMPPIPGLKEAGFITYREAIDLSQLPKSLFIIGGGAIGCEFAYLFNTFGVKVHVADMAPRLCALEDPEVGELIGGMFEQNGITIHVNVKVVRVESHGHLKTVFFEKDGQLRQVTVESIMVASGKAPNTNMGLENAGVKYDREGIKTNAQMQTSAKHIYAAGDVVGPYRFTHTAAYQSRIAAHNMYHKDKVRAQYHAIPRSIFIEPEVACVGATEQQLKNKKYPYQTAAVPIWVIGRANTTGTDSGFVKVIATKSGVLLGASIVSPRAGEMIQELTMAIQRRMTARDITDTIHAFPTWSEAVRAACLKIKTK